MNPPPSPPPAGPGAEDALERARSAGDLPGSDRPDWGGSWLRRVVAVAFMVGVYYGIQHLTGLLEIYPYLGLPEELTRRGGWVQAVDHHFWQMVLALVCIGVLSRGRWGEWGLNLRNREESLRLTREFVRVYGLYFIGGVVVIQLFLLEPATPGHPWTASHIAGRLAFGFLFVGLSEEILFRGLIHTYLARSWRSVVVIRGVRMPVAGILAAAIFTLAHVGFGLAPLEITHLRPLQLVQAAVLGLFYSWAYHRTGSLLAPILAHNFSDGALWLAEYAVYAIQVGPPGWGG